MDGIWVAFVLNQKEAEALRYAGSRSGKDRRGFVLFIDHLRRNDFPSFTNRSHLPFCDRHGFRDQPLWFLGDRVTQSVIWELMEQAFAPNERLSRSMELVCGQDSTRYEIDIRAWANREPEFESVVPNVDRARCKRVCELFGPSGFTGVACFRVRFFSRSTTSETKFSPTATRDFFGQAPSCLAMSNRSIYRH